MGSPTENENRGEEEAVVMLPFIDRTYPSIFFATAVMANAAFIGFDTDFRAKEAAASGGDEDAAASGGPSLLFIIDLVFFSIFLFELILRIAADRCPKFYYSTWNLLDLCLVVASGVDLLFIAMFAGQEAEDNAAKDVSKL